MFNAILVPLDGSTLSERALPVGCALARAFDARLVLVRVANAGASSGKEAGDEERRAIAEQRAGVKEEEHLLSTDPWAVERAQAQIRVVSEAEGYLAGVAERLGAEAVRVEAAVAYGDPAKGILLELELRSADLVVMCSHGRTGLRQLVAGSVAQAVLARSPVPVLLVPPAEGR